MMSRFVGRSLIVSCQFPLSFTSPYFYEYVQMIPCEGFHKWRYPQSSSVSRWCSLTFRLEVPPFMAKPPCILSFQHENSPCHGCFFGVTGSSCVAVAFFRSIQDTATACSSRRSRMGARHSRPFWRRFQHRKIFKIYELWYKNSISLKRLTQIPWWVNLLGLKN